MKCFIEEFWELKVMSGMSRMGEILAEFGPITAMQNSSLANDELKNMKFVVQLVEIQCTKIKLVQNLHSEV